MLRQRHVNERRVDVERKKSFFRRCVKYILEVFFLRSSFPKYILSVVYADNKKTGIFTVAPARLRRFIVFFFLSPWASLRASNSEVFIAQYFRMTRQRKTYFISTGSRDSTAELIYGFFYDFFGGSLNFSAEIKNCCWRYRSLSIFKHKT